MPWRMERNVCGRLRIGGLIVVASILLAAAGHSKEQQPGDTGHPAPEQMAEQFFSQFGGKDRVTQQEFIQHAKETFKKLDQDGDGVITRSEFVAFAEKQQAVAARIRPKMMKVQHYLEALHRKGADMSKVQTLMHKVQEAARAGRPEDVEKHLDEVLAIIEKQDPKSP